MHTTWSQGPQRDNRENFFLRQNSDVTPTCAFVIRQHDFGAIQIEWCRLRSSLCRMEGFGPKPYEFWEIIQACPDLSRKSLLSPLHFSSPGWGPVRVGARSGLGPIWALMGPYGFSWTGLGRSGHVRFPTFNRILHVLGSEFAFEEIFRSFGIIFAPGNSWARYNHQKPLSGGQKCHSFVKCI